MNELEVFNFSFKGKEVRSLLIDGEPYFVGKDVVEVLGYKNGSRDINRHVMEQDRMVIDNQKYQNGTLEIPNRGLIVINESGLYSLILSSKLSTAKEFQHWITSKVLPEVRKTGGYVHLGSEAKFIETHFSKFSDNTKLAMILELQDYNENLKLQLENQKPLVDFANQVSNSKNSLSMKTTAKIISNDTNIIGRNKLFEFLRNNGVLMSDNTPYQNFINDNYFVVKEQTIRNGKVIPITYVTGKGQKFIYDLLKKKGVFCSQF